MSRRRLMAGQLPGGPVAATGRGRATDLPGGRPARRVIAVLLLGAAALDLSRCGVAVASARDVGPMVGLVVAGLAAAGLSLWTAHACGSRRRWPAWAALLIGAASGPQAAVSGFHPPYTIPDTATAALGILLAVAVLATAGRTRPTGPIAPIGPTGPFPAGSYTSTSSASNTSASGDGATSTSTGGQAGAGCDGRRILPPPLL
jgi:hypothetical protein